MRVMLAVGMLVSVSSPLVAQTQSTPKLPSAELGVGVDATWLRAGLFVDQGVVMEPMVHFRATQPMTPTLAIEGILAVTRWFNTNRFDYAIEALYGMQLKQTVWRHQGVLFAGFAPMGARLSTGVSFPLRPYRQILRFSDS